MERPSFNTNQRLVELISFLGRFHPTFDDPELTKENLHEVLFPGEDLQSHRINNHLSYLRPLIEDFLVFKQVLLQPREKEQMLVSALEDRNKEKLIEGSLRRRRKKILAETEMDEEWYFHLYRTEEIADRHFGAMNARTQDDSLAAKQKQLDLYYITTKLKDACEMMNRQRIIQVEYDYFLIDQILDSVSRGSIDLEANPIIEIYYTILLGFREPEERAHHDRLLELLDHNAKRIGKSELRGLYDYAKNYCIRKINTGHSDYLAKLFEVFKRTLKSEVIYLDGQLSEWDYKNIVTVGTRLKEFEWTREFIEKQIAYLPKERQENAYVYNLAVFFYAMEDLDRTIELLRDVQFTDFSYNLGGRITLIKAYYDAEQHDPLLSAVTSFKLFLQRSKLLSPAQSRVNYNLIRFTERLSRLRFKRPFTSAKAWKESFAKLEKQVEETPNIANKAWLVERLKMLAPISK